MNTHSDWSSGDYVYISNSSAETSEGVYASIPGFQGSQLSSDQYKAVYDYVAQVSFLTSA